MYLSDANQSKARKPSKVIRRRVGTRSTPSIHQLPQDPSASSKFAKAIADFPLELALAINNSTTSNTTEEAERQKANEDLFQHLQQNASHLTMTADSMQSWNGDCWFAATAFHLNRLQSSTSRTVTADSLRQRVYSYMIDAERKKAFLNGPFCVFDDYTPKGLSQEAQYDEECSQMKKRGTWSRPSSICELAITCLAQVCDCSFTIHQSGQKLPVTVGDSNATHHFNFGRVETSTAAHIHALVEKTKCK